MKNHFEVAIKRANLNSANFRTLNILLQMKQSGNDLNEFFMINGYRKIAIYGFGNVGKRFVDELKKDLIKIEYIIDKKGDYIVADWKIYAPNDNLPEVDAIIVTTMYCYEEVKWQLAQKMSCPIISLDDVLKELK